MGKRLPAFYIYVGVAHYTGWHRNQDIGLQTVFAYTDNSWMKDYVSLGWLWTNFEKHTMPLKPSQIRLLLYDIHSSHDAFEFCKCYLENNIALYFLLLNATHVLQPLDVGVFTPLDWFYTQEVNDWTAIQPLHTSLLKEDFLPMCKRAQKKKLHLRTLGLHRWNVESISSTLSG